MINLALTVGVLTVLGTIVFILQLPLKQIFPKRNNSNKTKTL